MTTSIASEAYAQWIEKLISRGMEPWFVTFMFKQLPGSAAERQHQMLLVVERVYGLRITRIIKHPRAASNRDRRPIWLAAPDLPIFKHLKQSLGDVTINGGLHVHAVVLEPTDRRFPTCFAEYIWSASLTWGRLYPGLARIHVAAITHNVPRVVDYAFKQIEQRIGSDAVLILPQANDELCCSPRRVGRGSSIFGQTRPQELAAGKSRRR